MPRTHLEKLFLGVGGVTGLVMVLVGYFFFIGPQRSQTDSVGVQVSQARAHNSELQAHVNTLESETKNLPKYLNTVKQARLALPSTSGLPDFLRTLQSIGHSTLAQVASLTIGIPSDVSSLASPPAATAPAATAPSSTAAGSAASMATAPPVPVAHVYALAISAQVTGTAAQLNEFLTQLQSVQPRAVLISQITVGSASTSSTNKTDGGASTLSLTMQAFVAPTSAAEQAQLAAAAGK
jgi:type IV pilus assembly protein PilO